MSIFKSRFRIRKVRKLMSWRQFVYRYYDENATMHEDYYTILYYVRGHSLAKTRHTRHRVQCIFVLPKSREQRVHASFGTKMILCTMILLIQTRHRAHSWWRDSGWYDWEPLPQLLLPHRRSWLPPWRCFLLCLCWPSGTGSVLPVRLLYLYSCSLPDQPLHLHISMTGKNGDCRTVTVWGS